MKQAPFFLTMVILFVASAHEMGTYTSAKPVVTQLQSQLDKNKETALKTFHALSKGNLDASSFATISGSSKSTGAASKEIEGKQSMKEKMQQLLLLTNDYKAENIKVFADGDYVFIMADWTGSFKKDFMGNNAVVNSFRIPDVDIFRFSKNGEIIEHRGIQSINSIFQEISRNKK
jgi:hypothetical protein